MIFAEEFKKFLSAIDKAVPAELDIHLVCDNLSTHRTPAVNAWLSRHRRFHMHFTPTESSWLTRSNDGSAISPTSYSHAECTAASSHLRQMFGTGSRPGIPNRNHSSGSRPPKKSSIHWLDIQRISRAEH